MASTTQSALEYVRGARTHLVKTLKNLSVILENLKQQGVLRDEEVSRIQAEGNDYDKNRNLLDSVTKKGEAASYEFLKIIDITRKRTHGRTSLLPEKQMFDLHHWISCFPFKEDTQVGNNYLQAPTPCHRYQAKLKSKAQKISKEFWTANKDLFEENSKPDLSYMSLVLDTQGSVSPSKIKKCKNKKSRMSRCKKLGTYIPKDKADSSPSDLLKTDKNILLVGKSGIGKTALTHEMLKLWTEKDDKELNYMFYFDMRKISNIKSLEDLLFNEFSEPDEGNDEVLQDIKNNSDNVTLIFDGITDLSLPVVQKLVKKDLLKDSKVVVTCRPADEDHLLSEDFLRVEVKGFSEQTIKTFISRMLRERKERVLSNLELFTLCHVPMYALMVAACFTFETSEDFQKPCCITDIYINIFRFCLERNSNTKYIHLDAFIESKSQEILSLAEVAFRATEGKTVNLTLRPFRDSCVLSLLKQLVIKVAPTERITTYAFLHYTMQEFFAALWLLKNPDLISNVFQQCLTEEKKHMKHLIPYMCRLLTEKSPSLMEYLIPAEELKNTSNWFFKKVISTFLPSLCGNDDPDTEDSGRILFLCQCLYESQCPEACIDLLEQLDFHLDLSEESLDPYPCCAVAYVITQSKERKIWLNLEDVTMSQQGMRPLLGCLPNVQWCDSLPLQLWEIFLLSEGEMDYITLLGLDGNQLHLPVEGGRKLFERAVTVLQKISKKVKICLHWEREKPDCHSLCETLLEALPYVSSLSFRRTYRGPGLQDQERCYETLKRQEKQLFLDLCLRAANHIQGESVHNEVNDLISLFSFNTDVHNILLDFYQHVKTQESSVVIEKLKPFFQSAPAVWIIDLSERKSSILLEVLRLQPEKKQVELRGCSEEESEVRTLLQCLPHISQLSCGPEFFQRVCAFISVRSREETEQSAALLRMPGITLLLSGELLRETCLSVGRVLQLCGANVDLILKPRKMSDKEAFALFRRTTQLHSLKLSNDMALLLGGWVRRWGVGCQVTVEELSLCPQTAQPSHRVLLKVVSSLASLLRYWAVRQLDLTEVCVPALGLTPLLLHDGPLNIKLSEKNVQQLLSLLHELQDQDLTWSFLSKFGGDLTSFSLNWELLHLLLQHPSAQTLTVNMRKNLFLQENITRLLPYLDRIVFKRPSPSFVLTAIREIYKARASFIIPSLLRSLGHVINLTCREMSPMDCVALLYTLAHSDGVKLNLLWTSIPPWKIESILLNLDKVSQLSVDRNLLLRLVHGCTASGAQQGAAESLLRTVQHRLDLSCSSCVELPEEDQSDTLRLTAEDCRAVSTILRRSRRDTQLILQECEFQDSGLDLLFPVLHKVQLRASKAVLLQLVSLVPVNSEWDTVGRAVSLCKALEGELDLSHSSLDQRACAALALILDSSEELTELDLSHCQLTDQLLLTLSAQLHKVQVLDLSHNNITDASTDLLLQLVSINPSIHTVRVPSAPFPVRPTPVPVPPGVRHLQLPVLPIPVLLLRRSS
ncbi:uncharacterized protein LOC117549781 isoform X4 [Gymnodraco acuticeps]|uniref:Uncharacterized protein LOC117549781 isoform X4 n=1 Tax=Gymnodraco acuticeps TaxID=8218 RepID=A0A6P8UL22_GYMAC|nr:uncharacterized protein LOC117549781 isoform X4 [Gymnodraco acuticeps]